MSSSYTLVEVDIDNEGQPITIRSEAITGGKAISIVTNETVLYQSTVTEEYYRNLLRHSRDYRYEDDGETVSIAETLAAFPSGMEALDFIKHLPTPIYLGLDRSTLPISLKSRRNRQVKRSRQPHATLRAFLDDSVGESEDAAVTAVRRAGSSRQNAAVDLRQKILLTLFLPASPGMTTKIPSAKEIRTYEQYRRSLKLAFKTLGLNSAEISAAIDPFFSKLIDVASQLKEVTDLSDIFKDENDHLWRAYREWGELAPRIPLFEQAEILVRRFNDTERQLFERRDAYLAIMNSFFEDSNKVLYFEEDGSLRLRLPSGENASVYYMFSGERQLFVLITTLMFVEDEKQASILIIDEPELSLHLKWQEMFVDSLRAANSNVQLILATHSPSIILDNEQYCVDLV